MIIFRCKLRSMRACAVAFLILPFVLTGCASDPSAKLNCAVLKDRNGRIVVAAKDLVLGARLVAKEADMLRAQLLRSPEMAGFSGSIYKQIAGTETYSFAVKINSLRGTVARQVARQQAYFNDGRTLVSTKQRWSCELLADTIANLDLEQSSDQLVENLLVVEQQFKETAVIFSDKDEVRE